MSRGLRRFPPDVLVAGEVLRGVLAAALAAEGLVSHSFQHPDLAVFAGQDVVVVGAGQSAQESAALLSEAGARVRLLVRGR